MSVVNRFMGWLSEGDGERLYQSAHVHECVMSVWWVCVCARMCLREEARKWERAGERETREIEIERERHVSSLGEQWISLSLYTESGSSGSLTPAIPLGFSCLSVASNLARQQLKLAKLSSPWNNTVWYTAEFRFVLFFYCDVTHCKHSMSTHELKVQNSPPYKVT